MVRSPTRMAPHFYIVLLASITILAFWRGSREHRLAASACVLATIGSVALISPMHERYEALESGLLFIDFALMTFFILLSLRSQRFWLLWVSGLQLSALIPHLFRMLGGHVLPSAYAVAGQLWSYPILLIVGVAALRHHRRQTAVTVERRDFLAGA